MPNDKSFTISVAPNYFLSVTQLSIMVAAVRLNLHPPRKSDHDIVVYSDECGGFVEFN